MNKSTIWLILCKIFCCVANWYQSNWESGQNTTELGEKLTGVAFITAEKSAEILSNWTKSTLAGKMIYLKIQTIPPITQLYWPISPLCKQRLLQKILRPLPRWQRRSRWRRLKWWWRLAMMFLPTPQRRWRLQHPQSNTPQRGNPQQKLPSNFQLLEPCKRLPEKAWMPALSFFSTLIYGLRELS